MFHETWICEDCHLSAHGYDEHDTGYPMPTIATNYTDNVICGPDDDNHPGEDCPGDCNISFSWVSCDNEDCLQPSLGGTRYRYAYWEK